MALDQSDRLRYSRASRIFRRAVALAWTVMTGDWAGTVAVGNSSSPSSIPSNGGRTRRLTPDLPASWSRA